jgi:hypothetical protein
MMHRAAIAAATFRSLKVRRNNVVATPVAVASLRRMKNSFSSVAAAATGDVVSIPSPPTSNHRHVNLPNAQGSIIYIQKLMKLLLSLLTVSILSLQIEFCYALQASSHSLFIEHHHNLIISQTMKKNII